MPDIELAPGASRPVLVTIFIGRTPNTFPRFEYDIPGTYRAVFAYRVPGSAQFDVISNEFEVREE